MNTDSVTDLHGKEWQRGVLGVAVLTVWTVLFVIFCIVGQLIGWDAIVAAHPIIIFVLTTISAGITAIVMFARLRSKGESLSGDFVTYAFSAVPVGLGMTAIVLMLTNRTLQISSTLVFLLLLAFVLLSHPFTRLVVAAVVGYCLAGIVGLAGACIAALVFEYYLAAYLPRAPN